MGGPMYQNWPNAQNFFGIWRLKLFPKFKLGIWRKNLKDFFQCINSIMNYHIKCVNLGRVLVQPIHSITLTYYQFWYTLYQNCHRLDCFSSIPKIFFSQKIFGKKKVLGQKNFWVKKIFWSKKILVKKIFWSKFFSGFGSWKHLVKEVFWSEVRKWEK